MIHVFSDYDRRILNYLRNAQIMVEEARIIQLHIASTYCLILKSKWAFQRRPMK